MLQPKVRPEANTQATNHTEWVKYLNFMEYKYHKCNNCTDYMCASNYVLNIDVHNGETKESVKQTSARAHIHHRSKLFQ